MAQTHVNPTRMELTRLKKKLATAIRGHKLLKDKRDELMRQFLELVRENKALRERVEEKINEANKNFVLARAVMQEEVLNVALLAPKQEVYLETSTRNVMSVDIRLAECEKSCQLMAAEIEKTRRRVNALEHVMIPRMQDNIKYIVMKLDENERSTQIRLMKVKDMMLEQAHKYSERGW